MSPELETLDQLQGGDQPLCVVRANFVDDGRFTKSVLAMLHEGEVTLRKTNREPAATWEWSRLLENVTDESAADYWLSLTTKGARRIG